MALLALAGLIFLAIHFIPATPLRRTAIAAMGEGAYVGIFSLLSLAAIWWWVDRFNHTAYDVVLWSVPSWWTWLKAAILLFAMLLAVGGLSAPNPSAPQGGKLLERPDIGEGIFAITRHPLMWAFGLWALTHLISQPNWRGLWFFGLFALTALLGAYLQERRKAKELGAAWARFAQKTSFFPFLAIIQGRARLSLKAIGWWRIGLAILVWAIFLHLHVWLFGASPLAGL